MPTVKQWGNPRSGTKWLNQLLRANTNAEVLVNKTGYKHGTWHGPEYVDQCHVHTVKEPSSWLVSMLRYLHAADDPSKEDLMERRRWLNRLANEYATNNRYWNNEFQETQGYCLVYYEDLLESTRDELLRIAGELELTITVDEIDTKPRTRFPHKLGYKSDHDNPQEQNRRYYLEGYYYRDAPKKTLREFAQALNGPYHNQFIQDSPYRIWNDWLAGTTITKPWKS